ncbi:unnamed protein product [Fraxinus pennsylvanica]|uniref:Uncharacterized protein n=1 Tax=Fraxinus pennsylvanica TaxID=56036 RepID=A0AAD2A0H4_9LAMI|nr:unnamed protein product [Fraxinus pennsylvanica]
MEWRKGEAVMEEFIPTECDFWLQSCQGEDGILCNLNKPMKEENGLIPVEALSLSIPMAKDKYSYVYSFYPMDFAFKQRQLSSRNPMNAIHWAEMMIWILKFMRTALSRKKIKRKRKHQNLKKRIGGEREASLIAFRCLLLNSDVTCREEDEELDGIEGRKVLMVVIFDRIAFIFISEG